MAALSDRSFLPMRKLRAIFGIYLKECFAYPAAVFIWVIADAQTTLILPAVWLATSGNSQMVAGMPRGDLITYYIASMVLSQFITCHLMWDMAWDIREGDFSAHLLRPVNYFKMNLARNFSWRVNKLVLFIPLLGFAILVYGRQGLSPMHFSWAFLAAVMLAQLLSYVAAFCVAMTALWTTEFMSTFRLYYLPEMFLSGRLIPLSALPLWALAFSKYTHFRYMNYFPVQVLMGKLGSSEVLQGLGLQVGWILVFLVLGQMLFKRGVRRYTGVGM